MSISELCALPVADLAAKDSALFLWATFPQLPEALRLIQAWGFTYKSVAFVWLKQNRKSPGWFYGLGFWTRGNAEVCLLATRGHPKRQAANIHQFIISPVREHSRKPEEAREKIVALMGDLPRVELFARQSPPGWDVWGNEVEPTIPDFWTKCPEAADQKEGLRAGSLWGACLTGSGFSPWRRRGAASAPCGQARSRPPLSLSPGGTSRIWPTWGTSPNWTAGPSLPSMC